MSEFEHFARNRINHDCFSHTVSIFADYFILMDHFFNTVEQWMKFSPESKQALGSILRKHVYPKGRLIVTESIISNRIFYIEKGLTRTYYIKDGKDVTDWFSWESQFAASILSFLTRQPDRRNIELLEDSVLWSLDFHDLEQAAAKFHEIEHLLRVLVTQGLIMVQQRFDALHFTPAKDRYAALLKENPTIIKRAALGHIASYLGITQETLSRIRASL